MIFPEVCRKYFRGTVSEQHVSPHPVLLRVELQIIPMQICNGTNSFNGAIPNGFFCAGSLDGTRDACFGDSGGLLPSEDLIFLKQYLNFRCFDLFWSNYWHRLFWFWLRTNQHSWGLR